MILLVDAGNTSIKFGLSDGQSIIQTSTLPLSQFSKSKLKSLFGKHYPFQHLGISTVSLSAEILINAIPHLQHTIVSSEIDLPFQVHYTTPKSLGSDRLSAVAGALSLTADNAILVIDAGSAITYEFIENRHYVGGNIAPGLRLRFESLHQFTEKLPLLHATEPQNTIGTSTQEAINNGVVHGLIAEIEHFISDFNKNKEKITVFLTGGDAFFLQGLIKSNIFVEPNLTLLGILNILTHHNA